MISYGIHCYLLADGRENGLLVPADGHIFVTSYRVIYIGTPCNPQGTVYICTLYRVLAREKLKEGGEVDYVKYICFQNTCYAYSGVSL